MDLERLAREAGWLILYTDEHGNSYETPRTADLARFAALVLEEAAKVCDADTTISGPRTAAAVVRSLKPAASPPRP
jgi:hypothetical protein